MANFFKISWTTNSIPFGSFCAASLILACFLSVHFFEFVLTANFVIGAVVVVLSTFLYLFDVEFLGILARIGSIPTTGLWCFGPRVCQNSALLPSSDRPIA